MNPVYELAKLIDHSLLHPTMTDDQLKKGCDLAKKYDTASVCIKPYAIRQAVEWLTGSDVLVGTVIGFPHGNSTIDIKVAETIQACKDGAVEIDMVVNSLAGYANEIAEPYLLAELTRVIQEVIDACDSEISRDLEQTNMMRPWRILNLNYGIVATRSHQPELIEQAYDALVKNLPQDAREFFKEGLQQMDAIGYPEEVREVVERYNKMWGSEGVLH